MNTRNNNLVAYMALSLVTLIIGFSFMFVKIALQHAGAFDLLAHRFTAAAAGILPLVLWGKLRLPQLSLKKLWPLLLLSLISPILTFGFQTLGLEYASASEAGILFAMTPVLTLLFASILLKEKTTFLQKIGVLVSVFGVVYIFYRNGIDTSGQSMLGNVLLLLSVLSIVVYYIVGKKLTASYSPAEITFTVILMACMVFNGIAVFSHIQDQSLGAFLRPLSQPTFLWAVLYLGVLSTLLTFFLTNYALARIPASNVSIFNNLPPVIAVFSGVVILGEQLHLPYILGGIMVLLGVVATLFFKKKHEKVKNRRIQRPWILSKRKKSA